MPTRIFRSETGFQGLAGCASAGACSKPWIILFSAPHVGRAARVAELRPTARINERRERCSMLGCIALHLGFDGCCVKTEATLHSAFRVEPGPWIPDCKIPNKQSSAKAKTVKAKGE